MSRVDKVLLATLILLMPIGILSSYTFFNNGKASQVQQEQAEQIQKIEALLSRIADGNTISEEAENEEPTIGVSSITFDSSVGTLRVSGYVPDPSMAILVTVAVQPTKKLVGTSGLVKDPEILGQAVKTISIKPQAAGAFVFEYPVNAESGLVDIRFDQDRATRTIQFSLDDKRQVR
jgi:hypothetical protein